MIFYTCALKASQEIYTLTFYLNDLCKRDVQLRLRQTVIWSLSIFKRIYMYPWNKKSYMIVVLVYTEVCKCSYAILEIFQFFKTYYNFVYFDCRASSNDSTASFWSNMSVTHAISNISSSLSRVLSSKVSNKFT